MFTHVAARTVRCPPIGVFSRGASDHSSPPDPPRVLPAGARVCRPGFPPGKTVHLDQGTHSNTVERAIRPHTTRGSLCISSSSVWKHWKRIGIGRATRARLSGDRTLKQFRLEVTGADLVGRSGNNLYSRKNTGFNKVTYRVVCDAQQLCRLGHGKPCAVFFRRSIGVDSTHPSH